MITRGINRIRNKGASEEGFTLIELIIVVVIIGVLAAIAIPAFLSQKKAAVAASVKSDLKNTNITIALMMVHDHEAQFVGGNNAVRVTEAAPWFYVGTPKDDIEPVTVGSTTESENANTRAVISDVDTNMDIYGYWNHYVIEAHNTNLVGSEHNYYVFDSSTGKYVGSGDLL